MSAFDSIGVALLLPVTACVVSNERRSEPAHGLGKTVLLSCAFGPRDEPAIFGKEWSFGALNTESPATGIPQLASEIVTDSAGTASGLFPDAQVGPTAMDRAVEVCVTSVDADLELMAGVGARDPSAQRVLVQRLAGRVRKLAGLLCRNAADADDAAQLALIEILRSARGFRVSINLERWAERVTVRATRQTARRERARNGLLQRWLAPNVQPWGSSATQPSVDQIGLDTLLQRLSTERHQVLVLHHALDYTVDEISELTGTPVGTVKDRLIMARKQLRRLLESELGGSLVERA